MELAGGVVVVAGVPCWSAAEVSSQLTERSCGPAGGAAAVVDDAPLGGAGPPSLAEEGAGPPSLAEEGAAVGVPAPCLPAAPEDDGSGMEER